MTECSACGAELAAHETRCPICGKPTAYYHRQRRCLHCGTPAAEKARTCLMCGQPVDSLPLKSSIFSGSWLGIGLGVLIIVGIVMGLLRYQGNGNAVAQTGPASPTGPSPTPTARVTGTPRPAPATATPTPTPTTTATPTATATPTPHRHEVARGENPSTIADQYGISVEALIEANDIDDVSNLQVGQKLIIPGPSGAVPAQAKAPPPGPTPAQMEYEVKGGDTLLGIALDHGTSVEAIQAANPEVNLDMIFPGQTLLVPLATPTITPTPTTPPTATPTPGPMYDPPQLLNPAQGQVVKEDVLLFQWTATGFLARDEFYVLQLIWANGTMTEYWVKNSSWRVAKAERPAAGPVIWTVTIMRQTGELPDGSPQGLVLVPAGQQRTVEWP